MTVGCYKAGLTPPLGLSRIHAHPNALVPHFPCVLALYDALTRSLTDVRPHSWSFITARDKTFLFVKHRPSVILLYNTKQTKKVAFPTRQGEVIASISHLNNS
jgi:hypothetical protein